MKVILTRLSLPIRSLLFCLILALGDSCLAQEGWCGSLFKSVNVGCGDRTRSNSIGGSFPLLFDAFNVNPGSLPNYVTPVGVEAFMVNGQVNYSLIKGLDGIGFGTSVASTKNTFFSPTSNLETTFIEQVTGIDAGGAFDPNINLGTSIALLGSSGGPIQASLGVSTKYNKGVDNFDYSAGIVLKSSAVSLGISQTKKNDGESILTYNAGIKLHKMFIDYTYFESTETLKIVTKIFSFNYTTGGLQITYAYRRQVNPFITDQIRDLYVSRGNEYNERHALLGVNYRYNDGLSFGFFTNYVLDEGSSFTLQYLF